VEALAKWNVMSTTKGELCGQDSGGNGWRRDGGLVSLYRAELSTINKGCAAVRRGG
jgi:hypothetical protein